MQVQTMRFLTSFFIIKKEMMLKLQDPKEWKKDL